MPLSPELESAIDAVVDRESQSLAKLSQNIHANPELSFNEHKAAGWIAELLRARGFEVEDDVAGMNTALRARRGKKGGPRIAIIAEYDALPEIGHACGHNLIATGAVGAFLAAASVVDKTAGEIEFLGTPAEEGGGGKIKMINAGVFEGIDAAMMFHPFDRDLLAHPTLATEWIRFSFKGVPAHAAIAPFDGKSALQACMDTFRLVDGQRVHMLDGTRVHGYIIDGGRAVNIIPEDAVCEYSVRGRSKADMERTALVVERCARAAAMASDVTVNIERRGGYRDLKNNLTMARRFGTHLGALGRTGTRETDPAVGTGSTDMGDVSHVVPSIHPWLAIVDENQTLCHQHAFAHAAASARGFSTATTAAKAMARTAVELLLDESLRKAVREEWHAGI